MNIPIITSREAKGLAGRHWTLRGTKYRIGGDVRGGNEAFVYPLYDAKSKLVAYLRFVNKAHASEARVERTNWLIKQKLFERSRAFDAAPMHWATTEEHGRPEGFSRDFAATLHRAAPGMSWRQWKAKIESGNRSAPTAKQRLRIARSLIGHLATLETFQFVHGDLSDGNFLIDPDWREITLIDFDAFAIHESEAARLRYPRLTVAQGGVLGTPGYLPRDLETASTDAAFPYSDRFARDMLLLELLGYEQGDPADCSPLYWSEPELLWESIRPSANELGLEHLLVERVFTLSEAERPTSQDLAIAASCSMPDFHRQVRSTPSLVAVLFQQARAWAKGASTHV